MESGRNAFKILTDKSTGKRPLGRPMRRWEDNIKINLKEIGINTRRNFCQKVSCQFLYLFELDIATSISQSSLLIRCNNMQSQYATWRSHNIDPNWAPHSLKPGLIMNITSARGHIIGPPILNQIGIR